MSQNPIETSQNADKTVAPAAAPSGAAPVLLKGKIQIFPGRPLPDRNVNEIRAYAATTSDDSMELFALVCEPHLVPRLRAVPTYGNIINNWMATLIDRGVVFWPPAGQERFVLVYRDFKGKRLLSDDVPQAIGWREEEVIASVIKPMIGVLQDFRDKDFVHGSIRVSNLFDAGAGPDKTRKIVLGECLSLPPSYAQPVLYETIPRAMTDKIARGQGTQADDLYSFGVALSVMLRHQDPLAGYSDREIIEHKIEHGSYIALTGNERFKGSVLELLRGLLQDNPVQRWSIDDIMTWADGRRLSPLQPVRAFKAQRPITFANEKYILPALLAWDLHKNPAETLRLYESDELTLWLERALQDEAGATRVEKAAEDAQKGGRTAGFESRLAANISAALDPQAPIRLHGFSFMAEGIGTALAAAIALKKELKIFADLLSGTIIMHWVNVKDALNFDMSGQLSRFDSCRNYMRQTKPGFGIERCLYFLCPEAHCMSEKLKSYMVRSPEELVMAFEDMCQKGKAPALFIDRHIAAFLSVKDAKTIDGFLFDLDAPEFHKKLLANLKCLSALQKRLNVKAVPALAKAVAEMLPSIYDRFHDRQLREKLQQNINRFATDGDLTKIVGLLDNPETVKKDTLGFRQAMKDYAALEKEEARLESSLTDKATFGKTTGNDISALISCLIAGLVIILTSFLMMSGKTLF